MPTAYSYVRFSTAEQKKGDSLRRQTVLSEDYADKHGLTLDTSLRMHDLGLSAYDGSNVQRGALGGFLNAIERGQIGQGSYLLVESLDRISRTHVSDALQLFLSILNKGITVVTLTDGKVYNTESVRDNFTDLFVSILIMARAHEESAIKSSRLKAAWSNKRSNIQHKKLTAQCPKWMRLDDSRTHFLLIQDRAILVKEIVGLATQGMGQAQIAKRLNERNVPQFSEYGNGWHSSYIQKILTSPALYGELQLHLREGDKVILHGDPVPDYYPAVITKDDFLLLQTLRSSRTLSGGRARKGSTVPNLLSGVAKCGYCGSTMVLVGSTAKRIRDADGTQAKRPSTKVLVCDGARRGLGCYAVQWNYKDFELSFLSFCNGLDLDQLINDATQTESIKTVRSLVEKRIYVTAAEIGETKKQMENLIDLVASGKKLEAVAARIEGLGSVLEKLSETKANLELEIRKLDAASVNSYNAAQSIRDSMLNMAKLSDDDLFSVRVGIAERIRQIIKIVRIYPAGRLSTAAEVENVREGLIKAGYATQIADTFVNQTMRTQPVRTGRGLRGRYVSRKDLGRNFLIQAKNGGLRVVYPDFEDPCKLVVESLGVQGFSSETDFALVEEAALG